MNGFHGGGARRVNLSEAHQCLRLSLVMKRPFTEEIEGLAGKN
jgi:hypothetical protein